MYLRAVVHALWVVMLRAERTRGAHAVYLCTLHVDNALFKGIRENSFHLKKKMPFIFRQRTSRCFFFACLRAYTRFKYESRVLAEIARDQKT